MSWYIMNDSLPNWTDVVGALGAIATVWTLIKLLMRDKKRESEIESLSAIALQLKELQLIDVKRYDESKKPHIEITCDRDYNLSGYYFLYFRNINSNSQIIKYEKTPYIGGMVSRTANFGKEQDFAFSIQTPKNKGSLTMFMTYIVEGGYKFEQEIFVYHLQDVLTVRGFPIKQLV